MGSRHVWTTSESGFYHRTNAVAQSRDDHGDGERAFHPEPEKSAADYSCGREHRTHLRRIFLPLRWRAEAWAEARRSAEEKEQGCDVAMPSRRLSAIHRPCMVFIRWVEHLLHELRGCPWQLLSAVHWLREGKDCRLPIVPTMCKEVRIKGSFGRIMGSRTVTTCTTVTTTEHIIPFTLLRRTVGYIVLLVRENTFTWDASNRCRWCTSNGSTAKALKRYDKSRKYSKLQNVGKISGNPTQVSLFTCGVWHHRRAPNSFALVVVVAVQVVVPYNIPLFFYRNSFGEQRCVDGNAVSRVEGTTGDDVGVYHHFGFPKQRISDHAGDAELQT